MKTIVLTEGGSARVEDGPPAGTATPSTVPPSTVKTSDTGMLTPYRLWLLTHKPEEHLAYVYRIMRSEEGTARPMYRVHGPDGTDEVTPDEWKQIKASAKQTDAMAEAGPEGTGLIDLAREGRISFCQAVTRIEMRRRSLLLDQDG